MHGFPSSSADWLLAGPDRGLGYLLSDLGYDVWLGNTRGNIFSKNHTHISPENELFWRYSLHEIGFYDVPATIDYIIEKTNKKQLNYIGFSQGTSVFFIMCSERPDYIKKIKHMHAFAPVAYLKHTRSPGLKLLTPYLLLYNQRKPHEILTNPPIAQSFSNKFCNQYTPTQKLCSQFFGFMFGNDKNQFDSNIFQNFMGHIPAGCSSWQSAHFAQLTRSSIIMIIKKKTKIYY